MTQVADVLAYIEEIAPLRLGNLDDEYGLLIGRADRAVLRAGVCWLPDSQVLAKAEADGCALLVAHEHPWLGEQHSPWYGHQAPQALKVPQVRRRQIYQRTGMALIRVHSPWDAKPEVGIVDSCARWLGLGACLARAKYTAVYQVAPVTLGELTREISAHLPASIPARLFGPAERIVTRVGLGIGGFGGNQWHMAEEFHFLGAEVIIWGDMVEHIGLAALELNLPVIETLHSATEEPGMRSLMGVLAQRFGEVSWRFYPSGLGHYCLGCP
jgi:putative NIF3 family GTP cyclohydrolase 1 type 2